MLRGMNLAPHVLRRFAKCCVEEVFEHPKSGVVDQNIYPEIAPSGAMEYTVVVVVEGNDAPGLVYVTPYAATSIADYVMEKGRDVLIVYDDLIQHARAYRELSLLLSRPPGREAFPGDIFYIHSRMLERSTHLSKERGGGSLTALPVIETEAQDISAYIPPTSSPLQMAKSTFRPPCLS
jgi:F-type H+/Na+-transporting ATPase subunit alpha